MRGREGGREGENEREGGRERIRGREGGRERTRGKEGGREFAGSVCPAYKLNEG